ncbi:MAG: YkgJ family cysteine cluster protein [Proteobacteria bacterium]|nr:YkgJ family cysteine cluster protein [Pseudomonadota bacterium]
MRLAHNQFIKHGLRFTCQRCGNCCRARGNVQAVLVPASEVSRIAAFLQLSPNDFLDAHCDIDAAGAVFLRSERRDCRFLGADNRCYIYSVRPAQCRAWPFWIENLNPESWQNNVKTVCPGADVGRLWRARDIDSIAAARDRAEGFCAASLTENEPANHDFIYLSRMNFENRFSRRRRPQRAYYPFAK